MPDPIAEELIRVLSKYSRAKTRDAITLATPLENTGIDSLGMAEVMFELEDAFKIVLPDGAGADASRARSVGDLHAMITGLVGR